MRFSHAFLLLTGLALSAAHSYHDHSFHARGLSFLEERDAHDDCGCGGDAEARDLDDELDIRDDEFDLFDRDAEVRLAPYDLL